MTRTCCPRFSGTALCTRHCSLCTRAQPSSVEIVEHEPGGADQLLAAGDDGAAARLERGARDEEDEERRHQGHAGDQGVRNAEGGHVGVDQQHGADDERDDAADAERAEARDERLGDHERDAEQKQREPGVVDRQHVQREEPEQQAIAPTTPGSTKPGFENSKNRP